MAAEQFFTNTLLAVMILVSVMLFVCLLDAFIMSVQAHRAAKKFNKVVAELIEDLKEKAEAKAEEKPVEEEVVKPDYKVMTIGELKNIAKERKIKGYYNLKKADLVKVLSK